MAQDISYRIAFRDQSGADKTIRGCAPIQAINWLNKGIASLASNYRIRLHDGFLAIKERGTDGKSLIRLARIVNRTSKAWEDVNLNCKSLNKRAPFAADPNTFVDHGFVVECVSK